MLKKFLMKQALKFKGMSGEQADQIAKMLDENPELMTAMKKLEDNKEVKALFEKIQAETEEKIKNGMDATMAQMGVMMKYKNDIAKYQDELMPLFQLMQGMK
jgi:cell fate (sporulation/competence/biofilm development) regulator YlbF (YheA/YmcA/DUF963 family)